MRHVGSGFVYPHHLLPLDYVKSLPVVHHVYGQHLPPNTGPYQWMSYSIRGGSSTIRFLRRSCEFFPEFTAYVCDFISSIIDLKPDPARVNLMWTRGEIIPHVDEVRVSAINIGVENSNAAITHASRSKNQARWMESCTSIVCQDGEAYLLDVSSIHSVEPYNPNVDRMLITYAMGLRYERAEQLLKRQL